MSSTAYFLIVSCLILSSWSLEQTTQELLLEEGVLKSHVEIGTPPRKFIVKVGFYKEYNWVFGLRCSRCFPWQNKYNLTASRSGAIFKHEWSDYGTGQVSRGDYVAVDVLSIGGEKIGLYRFGLSEFLHRSYFMNGLDGEFSLRVETDPKRNAATPTQRILKAFPQQIVTMFMNLTFADNQVQENKTNGLLTYGVNDNDHCSDQYSYFPANNNWFFYGNLTVGKETFSRFSIKVTSENDKWQVDQTEYYAIASEFKANRRTYELECASTYPSISLGDGNQKLVIPGEFLVEKKGDKCYLRIKPMVLSVDTRMVIGNSIFTQNCLQFDYKSSRLGFSERL